jgi:hypothetical protein
MVENVARIVSLKCTMVGKGRSRAEAEPSQPPAAMLEAMISRGEAARRRYLDRLAQPRLTGPQRTRLHHLLLVLDGRLAHLRAELTEQLARPLLPSPPEISGRARRNRATYRNFLPREG